MVFLCIASIVTFSNMYRLNTRAGVLPRSASSHFAIIGWQVEELSREFLGRRFFVSLPSSLKTSRKPWLLQGEKQTNTSWANILVSAYIKVTHLLIGFSNEAKY